jgi:patatin-like phospholipase/acyl hydrolase
VNRDDFARVVVAGGYRIDDPQQPDRRFPPQAEPQVTTEVAVALERWGIGPTDLVVCGGANGADIIIAELAMARGATVWLLLPLPLEEFIARSVRLEGSDWEQRFLRLHQASEVWFQHDELSPGGDVFTRNNSWMLDTAVAAAPELPAEGTKAAGKELFLLAVWDRSRPYSVTSHLVAEANRLWPSLGRGLHLSVVTPGTKKLLALDGGGIRGVMSLEVLAKIESVLRKELGAGPEFVLADYFSYIGGTSTGAIIAAGLALGWPVSKLQSLYDDKASLMFKKVAWPRRLLSLFRAKFHKKNLERLLRQQFGDDLDLGSDQLRTLLMVVLHNSNSDSPWPLSSNPAAKYNDLPYGESNLRAPLWKVVRASSAAPTFFPPERVSFVRSDSVFVDGGITPYNNPALQLALMASVGAYRLGWTSGADEMLLVSVGTGTTPRVFAELTDRDMNVIHTAKTVPNSLLGNAAVQQDILCRLLGDCRHGDAIDSELGDLHGATGLIDRKLFSYVRYNAELSRDGLNRLGLADIDHDAVTGLDDLDAMPALRRIGQRVAQDVHSDHFAGFLDG